MIKYILQEKYDRKAIDLSDWALREVYEGSFIQMQV